MSFLYGRTTWGNWLTKFQDLISGSVADDQNVTCAVADRWRTRFAVDGVLDCAAPPATQDEILTQEHRQGYWGRYDDCCVYNDGSASGKDFIRQKTIWTSWHANFREWAVCTVRITQANTTANNYSTARVKLYLIGFDKDGNYTGITSGTTITPATDGTCSYTYSGCTMTFQIGNAATGKVTVDGFYIRSFADQYRGGVDWWRRAARNIDGNYTFTTGDVPTGTEGTDYEVNIGPTQYTFGNISSTTSSIYNCLAGKSQYSGSGPQGSATSGLAIKTNTALTGDHYEVSFTKAEGVTYFIRDAGYIYLQFGSVGQSFDGTALNGVEGEIYKYNLAAFLSASPANNNSVVQYWISVTPTHIAVVLNVEGASSWTVTSNLYAKVISDDPTYGTCWMRGYAGYTMYWYRNGASALIERAMALGKGFYDGGRDWQTGQGRLDTFPLDSYNYWSGGEWGSSTFFYGNSTALYILNHGSNSSSNGMPIIPWQVNQSNMPISDSRWQLAGYSLMDGSTPSVLDTAIRQVGKWRFRGYAAEGLWQTPSGTFNMGDELTDTITGDKYLLWNSGPNTFPSYGPESASYPIGIALEEK